MDKQLSHSEYIEKLQDLTFKNSVSLLLDGIEKIENFGLICRTAASVNIMDIYLHQPRIDLGNVKLKRLSRSTYSKLNTSVIDGPECKKLARDMPFYAIEVSSNSDLLFQHTFPSGKYIIVAGSESGGINDELITLCDKTFHLPIVGEQSSINLACALSSAIHWTTAQQLH